MTPLILEAPTCLAAAPAARPTVAELLASSARTLDGVRDFLARHPVDGPAQAESDGGPGEIDPGPCQTMAERVASEASFYQSWGNGLGDLIAETLAALARGIRSTGATTPDEYRDRIAVLDAAHEADLIARGYDRAWAEADASR